MCISKVLIKRTGISFAFFVLSISASIEITGFRNIKLNWVNLSMPRCVWTVMMVKQFHKKKADWMQLTIICALKKACLYLLRKTSRYRRAISNFVTIELRRSTASNQDGFISPKKSAVSLCSQVHTACFFETIIHTDGSRLFQMALTSVKTSVSANLPDIVRFAFDLIPAEVHFSCLIRATPSQSPTLSALLLPLTVHCGLAWHTVASRPRRPPRS